MAFNIIGIAWLAAGVLIGVALGLWLGPVRHRKQAARAKVALAESQQRRALERLREHNLDLTAQLESAAERHSRATAALAESHAADIHVLEDKLRDLREQMRRLIESGGEGHLISGTAFVETQFGEPR